MCVDHLFNRNKIIGIFMNTEEIVKELRLLVEKMVDIGADMDYYGGFSEIGMNGKTLITAARSIKAWVDFIEIDVKHGKN